MDLPFPGSEDEVLAQPTRARLFALLTDLKRPAGTVELAEQLGLHPNGVRLHLERMREAGLVERSRPRQAVGRPRDAWTIAAGARPGGRAPSAYADLGRWLARAIAPGPRRLRDIEATGREIGRELAPARGGSLRETLETTLASLGFQPHMQPAANGGVTFCLGNCPYRDAVRENQEVVCTLHRGLTRGLLDVLDPRAELAGFVPRDPDEAGCLVELSGVGE
ncbi:MAG TPA: helix-turn-helix domain-containing protein [Thermoleophilaceae bacterium]